MDAELDKIKKKRLEEMKRRMALKKINKQKETEKPSEVTSQQVLDAMFGDRAWEVFNAAAQQYPQLIQQIERILVEGIKEGKIMNIIDGATLMGFFRQVGIPVRLNTKIRISDKGELKTLEQKMKEKQS